MYKQCKTLGIGNSSVTTSMIWGSLWDETLKWLVDSEALISNNGNITKLTNYTVGTDSFSWGNYPKTSFAYYKDKNQQSELKPQNSSVLIPAGSADYTKANNIYDMAGNVYDGTLEARRFYGENNFQEDTRIFRGGCCDIADWFNSYPASFRDTSNPTGNYLNLSGCRAMLLIN